MSFTTANDFSNLLAELFPCWLMLKSPISTNPFLSRSIFAKELVRVSKKYASFMFGALYAAAIRRGLRFGRLISTHNSSSLFVARSFLTVKGILSHIENKTPPPFNFVNQLRSFRTSVYPGIVTSQSDMFEESQVSLRVGTSKL